MTQRQPSQAEAKRRKKELVATSRDHKEQLHATQDRDLDALVAGTVFRSPELAAVPLSTSWDGLGCIVEHMQQRGYTLLLNVFEPSHLDWMNQLPSKSKPPKWQRAPSLSRDEQICSPVPAHQVGDG